METVSIDGIETEVKELYRPENCLCRLLETIPDTNFILEYVVSTGPYKIDVVHYQTLTADQFRAFETGELDLGAYALELEREQWNA